MDLSAQIFSGPQVADIAGVSPSTLQSWLTRYDPKVEDYRPAGAGSQGRRRHYSFYNVIHFSLAAVLVPMLRSTEQALNAGATFAHVGSPDVEGFSREPGIPYQDPNGKVETMLCVSEKGTCVVPKVKGFDWWNHAQMLLGSPESGILCRPVDRVWADICWKMDLRPHQVTKAAMGSAE